MKVCPKCNTQHEKPGIFCSRKCANSRSWSDEAKKAKSISLKKYIEDHPEWIQQSKSGLANRVAKQKETAKAKHIEKFKDGAIVSRTAIKKFLILEYGEQCSICNMLPMWHSKFLSLQVDHINGINKDNRPENLRLVCPNCHSQTETFAGKKHRK
jgi:hypothetical protein